MIKKVIAGFLTFGFAFNVCADVNVESIRYEDSAVVGQTTLQLNGAGLRKKVFFKVYAAGLYVPQKAQTAQGVLEQNGAARVRLGLLRDVSAKSFVSALEEGLQDNTDEATRKEIASELAKLIKAMNEIGDVKEGDLVDFDFSGKTTSVLVNGKLVADNIGGKKLLTRSCESGWAKTRLTTSSKRACSVSDEREVGSQNETGAVLQLLPF